MAFGGALPLCLFTLSLHREGVQEDVAKMLVRRCAVVAALVQAVAFPSFGEGVSRENPALDAGTESDMSIKELLFRDFGFDLPISSSSQDFGDRANPIVIHSSDPKKIIDAMYLTVHGMNLGLGRAIAAASTSEMPLGVLWRPHPEQWLEYHPKEQLYSLRFERKALKEDEIDNQVIRYYFKLSDFYGAMAPRIDRMDFPSVSFGSVRLPVSIGWLHHNQSKTVDYAKKNDRPDLGMGFAYEALGIKATVFVYPVPAGMEQSEDTLSAAFEQSVSEVETLNDDIKAWPDREPSDGFRERAWMVGEAAERATVLGMGIVGGHFVKYRLTWTRDQELDKAAGLFMGTLKHIVTHP